MKFSALKQHRIFPYAHVDNHISVYQLEGLRGLLCTRRDSGVQAKTLTHQSLSFHHQVYWDQMQLIHLSLWKAL